MTRRPIVMVAAVARNGVIGRDNTLPWRMRSDLKHFRAATWGKPLVMGRRTFESIGRPLPGRETVVVTRDRGFRPEGAVTASGIDEALDIADDIAARLAAPEVIIAGGGAIYEAAMAHALRLLITEIDLEVEGEARFPFIDPVDWRLIERVAHPRGEGDDAPFSIASFERRGSKP